MPVDDPMQHFARELRLWARRPTAAPPPTARSRLLDAIECARPEVRPRRPRLATVLAVVAVAALLFLSIPSGSDR